MMKWPAAMALIQLSVVCGFDLNVTLTPQRRIFWYCCIVCGIVHVVRFTLFYQMASHGCCIHCE